jgi:hypothetical protein
MEMAKELAKQKANQKKPMSSALFEGISLPNISATHKIVPQPLGMLLPQVLKCVTIFTNKHVYTGQTE